MKSNRTDNEALEIMNIIRNTNIEDFPLTQEAKELQEFLDKEMEKHKKIINNKESEKRIKMLEEVKNENI